jgi:hypothetical protein
MQEQALKVILENWGVIGAFIVLFIITIYVLWKSGRKDTKELNDEHARERKIDRDIHMEEFKKLFADGLSDKKELMNLIRTYSEDSKEFSLILKELELTIKHSR